MQIVIMGVSGCGKTTVGKLLAHQIGGQFFDGDHFHTEKNVEKMRFGAPLTDSDRKGWLDRLRDLLASRSHLGEPTVLACSALKQSYRDALFRALSPVPNLVYLHGSYDTVWRRMEARKDHYMPASLLRSQFEALEEPTGAIRADIDVPPVEIVSTIRTRLGI